MVFILVQWGLNAEVVAELCADLGVHGRGAVVEGLDRKGGGVGAVNENVGDHVRRLDAEVCVVNAVAEECAVEREGVGAREVGDARLCEGLVNRKL